MFYKDIFGGEPLPRILTTAETTKYCLQLQNGDKEARNFLIEHNLRLVASKVKKFLNTSLEASDLMSIGTIGLMKAVDSFRVEKNTKLITYASTCIENEILMVIRSNKKHKNEISLDEIINEDMEGHTQTLLDKVSDNVDIAEQLIIEDEILQIKRYFALLNNIEQKVMDLNCSFASDNSIAQNKIGKILNIRQSYVSKIIRKSRAKIKLYIRIENFRGKLINLENKNANVFLKFLVKIFEEFTDEEIEKAVNQLSEKEIKTWNFDFSNDNFDIKNIDIKKLKEKMILILNPNIEQKNNDKKEKELPINGESCQIAKEMLNVECSRKNNKDLIDQLINLKQQAVLLLRLGYIRNHYYSEKEISYILKIDELEVNKILVEGLFEIMKLYNNQTTINKKNKILV